MSWSKRAFGTMVIFGLVVLVSLLIVAQSGCAKKSAETKQTRPRTTTTPRPTTAVPDPSSVDLSKYLSPGEKLLAKLFADVNKDGNKEIIFLSGKDAEWQKRAKEKGFEWMGKVPPYYEEARERRGQPPYFEFLNKNQGQSLYFLAKIKES